MSNERIAKGMEMASIAKSLKIGLTLIMAITSIKSLASIGQIIQLNHAKQKSVARIDNSTKLKKGDFVFVSTKSGGECNLLVLQIKDQLIVLDTQKCQSRGELRIGQKIEKDYLANFSSSKKKRKITKTTRTSRHSLGTTSSTELRQRFNELSRKLTGFSSYVLYNTSTEVDIEGTTEAIDFTGTTELNTAIGMGVEYKVKEILPEFYLTIGGSFEFGRELNKYTLTAGKQQERSNFTNPRPVLSFWNIYALGVFELLPGISVLGGLNFTLPKYKNLTGRHRGRVGLHAGASYRLSKHFAVDALYRTLNFKSDIENYSYDSMSLAGLTLRARYIF